MVRYGKAWKKDRKYFSILLILNKRSGENVKMNSRTFIKFCLVVVGTIIILGLVIICSEDIKKLGATEILIEIVESSTEKEIDLIPETAIYPELTLIDRYEVATYIGTIPFYDDVYIYHDDKRNVTCYLYNDGISCIPDCYIGVKE